MTEYPLIAPYNEPFGLFTEWYHQATKQEIYQESETMVLATADAKGKPSARVVLLKHFDAQGFCFYTNLTSHKGYELKENPHAALLFYWEPLHRQIRIEGTVERVSEKEADDYFAGRMRGSQLGAWASKQSLPMKEDGALVARVKEITEEFEAAPIPRPPFWSGFRVKPARFEFWEEGEHRLHKRICYRQDADTSQWQVERLYP